MIHRCHCILRTLSALLIFLPSLNASCGAEKAPENKTAFDYTHNVDPFIGVDWGGNTFVGSTVPFGMLKVGPDMETFDGRRSGFGYQVVGWFLAFLTFI